MTEEPWTDVDLARFRGVGHALRSLRVDGAAIVVRAADEMERRGQRIRELEAALTAERATSQRRLELLRPFAERYGMPSFMAMIPMEHCRAAREEVDRV